MSGSDDGLPAALPSTTASHRYRASVETVSSATRMSFRVDLGFEVYRSILTDLHGLPADADIPRPAVTQWLDEAYSADGGAWPLVVQTIQHIVEDDPYYTVLVGRRTDDSVLNQRLYTDYIKS